MHQGLFYLLLTISKEMFSASKSWYNGIPVPLSSQNTLISSSVSILVLGTIPGSELYQIPYKIFQFRH